MAEIWKLPDRDHREDEPERPQSRSVHTPDEIVKVVRAVAAPSPDGLYDDLESDLVRRSLKAGVRSLMLTGAQNRVGVSTIAARFAHSVSRDPSVRVLLVDTHLRAPSLDRIFTLPDGDSFYDLLTGATGLDTLAPASVENLHVLTAGRSISDPRAFFRRSIIGKIVNDLVSRYDLVVFDAPPIRDCVEARTLAAKVDGVVLVVRGGQTSRREGRLAIHQIGESGAPLLGVVLNSARSYVPRWLYDRI